MVNDCMDLLLKYPLINQEIRKNSVNYKGIISCQNQDYNLHVVECCKNDKVYFKIKTHDLKIDSILNQIQADNIVDVLDKVSAILSTKCTEVKNPVIGYRRVLHEYYEFTKFHFNLKFSQLSPDLSEMRISASDECGRAHSLQIAINCNATKDVFTIINPDLPEQLAKDFEKSWSSLTELYNKFVGIIDSLQDFFDIMGELDQQCYVLDPERPTRRECFRRIWLSENMSMLVTIDPFNVKARPELKFLGPEHLVLHYREKLNSSLLTWDETTHLLEGILNILGINSFPPKPENNVDMLINAGECSICFALRFNDKLPEVACSNKSCENFYHINCLYEWLSAVNSKRIFNQIHGQCPNCEKGISCPLPDAAIT